MLPWAEVDKIAELPVVFDVLERSCLCITNDVAVEDAISDRPSKRGRSSGSKRGLSRQARDNKFGFGSNPGRRAKQNTKSSTDDFGSHRGGARGRGGFRGARGGRGGFTTKRPGKSRRADARSR